MTESSLSELPDVKAKPKQKKQKRMHKLQTRINSPNNYNLDVNKL